MLPGPNRAALAAMLVLALAPNGVSAQGQGLQLERSLGAAPAGRGPDLPTFLTADRIEGLGGVQVEATGNAEIRRGDTSLTADRIKYFAEDDEAEATGNVRLQIGADEMSGPRLRMRIGDSSGIFEQPSFRLGERAVRSRLKRGLPAGAQLTATDDTRLMVDVEGRGEAAAIRFEGDQHYRITDGTFTTCKPGQDDWFIQAEELDIDMQREVGTARGASITFLGVSTPRIPWFDFSLNNERKSGFLPPTAGIQNNIGFEVMTPFYWNIAPNYDATIAPRYMAQRGLQFLNQFRFLTPNARGEARYEILPADKKLNDETRYATAFATDYNFQNGLYGLVNYQKVSDDNYFRDLSGRLSIATQTYLPQQALATYGAPSGFWSATANYQRFQTLQDAQNPVPIPYFREPQFLLNALRPTPVGLDVGFRGEYVNFGNAALVPTGSRTTAYPWLSWPMVRSYGFVTPKVGVTAIGYNLATPGSFTDERPSVALPIASVDSGLFFERDARWFGTEYLQTFEPRAYYVYVPYKDQSAFPVFDTTTTDLNYTQLFQENIFVGGDRIANANQISIGATSRLVRPSDGQEQVRVVIGQRYFFTDQKVTIPGEPVRTDNTSPLILGLAGRIAPSWTAELGTQYQFGAGSGFGKAVAGVRYSPAPAAVASISYRYTNQDLSAGAGTIENVDAAAQWPLGGGVYGVARYSYDLVGRQTVEALLGLEYNAGCWIIRAVAQQFQTATAQETTLFFVQVEFNGFARIGSNPLEVLRRSIPGYSLINQSTAGNRPLDSGGISGTAAPLDTGTRVTPIRSGAPGAYGTYD
jgi:LPS-assembly protein